MSGGKIITINCKTNKESEMSASNDQQQIDIDGNVVKYVKGGVFGFVFGFVTPKYGLRPRPSYIIKRKTTTFWLSRFPHTLLTAFFT